MRFLMASTVIPKASAASYTETALLPEEGPVVYWPDCPVSWRVLLDNSLSRACTPPDFGPVLSCTASSIEKHHIGKLPSVIGPVRPYTTCGDARSLHTRCSSLNLDQPSRLNIVHLVIVRTYCRVLKAWVSRRTTLRGSYGGGKILGREGGIAAHPSFLRHVLYSGG